jgi:hypothetical protein
MDSQLSPLGQRESRLAWWANACDVPRIGDVARDTEQIIPRFVSALLDVLPRNPRHFRSVNIHHDPGVHRRRVLCSRTVSSGNKTTLTPLARSSALRDSDPPARSNQKQIRSKESSSRYRHGLDDEG